MKVFKQVPIEEWLKKEHQEGRYMVIMDGEGFTVSYIPQFGLHEEFIDCSGFTHVLEEVELSELIKEMMPSYKEIEAESDNVDETQLNYISFKDGAEWLRDKLLNKTNE